jgi:hypothetical protein
MVSLVDARRDTLPIRKVTTKILGVVGLSAGVVLAGLAINSVKIGKGNFRLLTMARAEDARGLPPYGELKLGLSSKDVIARISARRLLGINFERYQDQALEDLFSLRESPNYTVSLLNGLVAAIDAVTDGKLSPDRSRDLSTRLPFISNRVPKIVAMTGDRSQEVGKEALRLVERFPVDDFRKIYDEISERIVRNCASLAAADLRIRWGAIFFYYNRIIQFMYQDSGLSSSARSDIDAITKRGVHGAECLPDEQRVDAGALYFARAVVFDHFQEPPDIIRAETARFNAHLALFGGDDYYLQTHIDRIHELEKIYRPQ